MRFTAAKDERSARLVVRAGERVGDRIGPFVTGEFCEHLGSNIYNGMCAQILRNPTFSPYPFATGRSLPDGGVAFESDPARLKAEAERLAARTGWPAECLEPFSAAPEHGLALFWIPEGGGESVRCSPDIGPEGRRAQRVRILAGGAGIAQWTYLPAHRVRRFT